MNEVLPHDAFRRVVHAAFGDGARIGGTERLCGDASNRVYVRLRLVDHAPPTAVAMLLGDRPLRASDELGGGAHDELPFTDVGRWLARHGLPVPALYRDASRTDGLLLIEDVGDVNLWSAASAAPAQVDALFDAAVDLLVALQVAGARDPDPACCAFHRHFDGALARAELEHFIDHGIETRHGRTLPAAERAAILADLALVETPFRDAAGTLVHRDFMAWNLHVQVERLRLIDFQDALLGPDAYDLAALLTDRHTPQLITAAREARLLDRFAAARTAAGLPVAGDLRRRYRLCALHRALKVIGRFYFLEVVKQKPGYLAYLPGVYGVARRMLDGLPELAAARARIVPWVPELAAA